MKALPEQLRLATVLPSAAVLLGSALAAVGVPGGGTPAAAAARPWNGTTPAAHDLSPGPPGVALRGLLVPKPGSVSFLTGVFCTKVSSCWAVGFYRKSGAGTVEVTLDQALHWDGRRWSRVSTPNPGGTANGDVSDLFGIRCTSGTNCWAVGAYWKSGTSLNQVLHWNGRRWSTVAAPNPGGTANHAARALLSASCTAATNCWAVGFYEKRDSAGNRVTLNQALHWDGRKWSGVSVPNPAGTATDDDSELNSVRCASARDCWAVGFSGSDSAFNWFNQALHWNGRRWSTVATPSPGGTANGDFSLLNGLSCTAAANCWAAGTYGTFGNPSTLLNQALHWNGHTWSLVSTPEPDGTGAGAANQLHDVSCTSASNCWAAGNYGSVSGGVGSVLNQALHWDGGVWSLASTPDPAGTSDGDLNDLEGVRCTSASNCWAVGNRQQSGGADVNQALHWNGRRWTSG